MQKFVRSIMNKIAPAAPAQPKEADDPMRNPGFIAFNTNPALLDGPRTVICTGLGRSGTSAVSSLLEFLGIWVGAKTRSRNRENKELIRALSNSPEEASALIERYNNKRSLWGFKAPSFRKDITETVHLFRNPMLIVPHRDPIGRLGRQMVSGNREASLDDIYKAIVGQRRLVDGLRTLNIPQLHISFPLLGNAPEVALQAIAEFVGVPVPAGDLRKHMDRAREHYLSGNPPSEGQAEI